MATDCQQPTEAGKDVKESSPRAFRESISLSTPGFQTPSLQNCERVNLLWQLQETNIPSSEDAICDPIPQIWETEAQRGYLVQGHTVGYGRAGFAIKE